jgi:hypothetical protein
MRRRLGLALGALLVVVVVAAILAWLPRLAAPTPPVAQVHGLPILTVSEALAARQTLDETEPIAVHGWYSEGLAHSCPAPSGPDGRMRETSPLELYCHRGEIALAERNESPIEIIRDGSAISTRGHQMSGPYLDPYMGALVITQPIWPFGLDPSQPAPLVAIGHFADHRAVDCLPEDVPFCLSVFVIDNVAVLREAELGPVKLADPQHGRPTRTFDEVEAFVAQEYGQDASAIAVASMAREEVALYEDRANAPARQGVVWLVRVIDFGPNGEDPGRLVSAVIDDVTLEITWSSDQGAPY